MRFRIGVLVCLCACLAARAQGKLDQAFISQINAKVTEFMTKTGTPGVSVAIVKDGAFVWATGYGLADLENNVPATDETMYRLASVSKAVSATGAMWLAEYGKLDLDAPVQKYCPGFVRGFLKRVADYHARGAGAHGRYPALQE